MRILRVLLGTLAALAVYAVLVLAGTREGWWRPLPAAQGDNAGFIAAARARFTAESKGNIALVLLDKGKVAGSLFASHGRPVDGASLFQVASMSKWFTAWGVMRLVQDGRIDLDAPVSRYLKRWRLPPSAFDNNAVTVRRLLSHTAGLTDNLGYLGYPPGRIPQALPDELTHAADAMPGRDGHVRVGIEPGTQWRYSGGGYALLQLLIEDVTGEHFNDYMRKTVLLPLGMTHSTFVAPDLAHLADNFDADGGPATRYTFTALGAASLFTSTDDLTRFLQAQVKGPHGEPAGRGVLSRVTLGQMRHVAARLYLLPIWGLGEILYAPNGTGSYVIGHDGNNFPGINTTARIDPATGDGIIMLSSGNATLASGIGGDWTYWKTGVVDLQSMVLYGRPTLIILGVGAVLILLGGIVVGWRGRRPKAGK